MEFLESCFVVEGKVPTLVEGASAAHNFLSAARGVWF